MFALTDTSALQNLLMPTNLVQRHNETSLNLGWNHSFQNWLSPSVMLLQQQSEDHLIDSSVFEEFIVLHLM